MKQPRISRRQFFKLNVFGAGALALPAVALASVATAASREAQAAADEPHLTLPQPTFNAINSTLPSGAAPADISMGWDGTLWAIDASGAPHLYDPVQQQWIEHGDGIDGAASFNGILYLFRDEQVLQINESSGAATLTTIAQAFPNVPDSFKLGVVGAAVVEKALVLFKGGRFVRADGLSAPQKLTDLSIWPKTAPWKDGLVSGVYYDSTGVYFFNGDTYFGIYNLFGFTVGIGPGPASQFYNWAKVLPPSWLNTGIDAGIPTPSGFTLFKGTRVAQFSEFASTPMTPAYLPAAYANWPITWNPALNHAPSGRMGNLWCATRSGGAIQHNGDAWVVRDGAGNGVTSVASGSDGSTFLCGSGSNTLWQWTGATWNPVVTHAIGLSQVATGSAGHVWVRDANNLPHRLVAGALTAVNLGAGVPNPTHMAANDDGTLWHCNSGNANAFRFVSEATAASAALPLKSGITASVQRVASTGFGAAHCLATHSDGSAQVYRYDSPYVFKTSKPYVIWGAAPMAQGLGRLYFVQLVSYPNSGTLNVRFVALDAHTGAEVASYTPSETSTQYTGMVFDPIHELVYVGAAPLNDGVNNTTPGQVSALDARTLAVKWTYQTKAGVDGTPALNGAQLCFGDRTNTLYMFDTSAALANAAAPKPAWTWAAPTRSASTHRVTTPVIANGKVHVVAWDLDTVAIGGNEIGHYHYLAQCDAATGLNGSVSIGDFIPANASKPLVFQDIVTAPALGRARATDGSDVNAAFVNDGFSVYAHSLDQNKTPQTTSFPLPTGHISTGFAWDDGTRLGTGLSSAGPSINDVRLWFGDDAGNVWSLNSALQPVDNTPNNLGPNAAIFTTPILYKDPQGGVTVLFGVSQSGLTPLAQPPSLYGYDPKAGQRAAIPTGVTQIWNLAQGTTNGVVYAAGGGTSTPDGEVSQVFGIRVDELPQALRDFIIESQMMQDPDPSAPGGDASDPSTGSGQAPANPIPPSRARYQTHLTIVDDGKHPIPFEPVKIWADQPMTIQVDGTAHDIGPGDTQYAAVKTGSDGALVITSGYAKTDGSDTPDMYAPALRVWASFMDPFERVVVNPDHEFHQRTATAHSNASDDDPNKVNLVTCKSYAGRGGAKPTALFTSDEVSAGQPANCANAIGQMKSGVGFGGGGASNVTATLFNRLMVHAGGRRGAQRTIRSTAFATSAAAAPPPKYVAYTDLTGSGYFPTNIPAMRPTAVSQPTGLAFVKPQGQPTTKATFRAVHHTDAAAAIDALPPPTANPPWATALTTGPLTQPLPQGKRSQQRADNIFTDFWNWLKGVAAEITHIIVSIADEVTVGIRLIVNGVEQIFKAVIKVIDDIASAVGSFFKMIEKFIEDVVAALSTLFNFGEIMWTHRWLAGQVTQQTQAIKDAIASQIIPALDSFFKQGEDAIKSAFATLRKQITPNNQLNDLRGSGSTTHTALSVQTPSGGTSNQAVQGNWGMQKMKAGLPSATAPAGVARRATDANADDPISAFASAFVTRITGDGDLAEAFAQLQSDFGQLFRTNSAGDFFTTLLNTLLDIIEALVIGALAVSNALVDGILAIAGAVIDTIVATISTPLDIPVLSWLYKQLFNEQLTWLNLGTLVAAIPVTAIYRAAVGRYPSQDLQADAATSQSTRAAKNAGAIVYGLFAGFSALGVGVARAVRDAALDDNEDDVIDSDDSSYFPAEIARLSFTVINTVCTFPLNQNSMPDKWAWANFGGGLVSTLIFMVKMKVFSDNKVAEKPSVFAQAFLNTEPYISCIVALARAAILISGFIIQNNTTPVSDLGFANGLASVVPPIVGPLRRILGEPVGVVIAVVADVTSGVATLALQIIIALLLLSVDVPSQPTARLFFPFVPFDPLPVLTQPHP